MNEVNGDADPGLTMPESKDSSEVSDENGDINDVVGEVEGVGVAVGDIVVSGELLFMFNV